VLLGAVCIALFSWRLGAVPLMGFDEGCYSECSREMLASGDYIVPTCNGEPFFDKPPVTYWLQAASMRTFGVNSFAVRLPSAVAMLALVALTVFLGTRLFSRRAGLMAGFVLATSTLAAGLARMAIIDALFGLTIAASLGAFALAYLELAPKSMYLLFWASMGVSVMVKGPAGAVLIVAAALIFLLIRRDVGAVRRSMPLAGVALAAAISLPWYVAVNQRTGGAFLQEFIVHQNLQRAMGKDFSHNAPVYYYLPVLLAGFFPWSVFLPGAFLSRTRRIPKSADGAALFLMVWIGTVFVTFSILRSKLPGYIFPIYPACALMVARLWDSAMNEQGAGLRRSALAAGVTACALGAVMLAVPPYLQEPIPGLSRALIPMAAALVIGCAGAYAMLLAKRPIGAFASLCAGMAIFLGVVVGLGLPIAARTNAVPAMKMGRSLAGTNAPAFTYRLSPPQPQIAFYAGRPVADADELPDAPCLLVTQVDRSQPSGVPRKRIGPYVLLRRAVR